MIMEIFDLPPCREVGILKNEVREAILDCKIENEILPAYTYLLKVAEKLDFKPVKTLEQISVK
jgi:hypothetical protein